jgi:hypothetical protein
MSNITPDAEPTANERQQPDLESRIAARRAELIKLLSELKADTRMASAEARDKLKARLSELAHLVKWGIVDSWASVSEPVAQKLRHWLAESAPHAPASAATAAPAKAGPS